MTGHAERVLMTRASTTYDPAFLKDCSIYTSAEPCAMCAGAIYWTGLKRCVFGMTEASLLAITRSPSGKPHARSSCRVVFAAGQRQVEVIGTLLAEEAAKVHEGAWD